MSGVGEEAKSLIFDVVGDSPGYFAFVRRPWSLGREASLWLGT